MLPATAYADHSTCSHCQRSLLTLKGKAMSIKDKYGCSVRICSNCFDKSVKAQNAHYEFERRAAERRAL